MIYLTLFIEFFKIGLFSIGGGMATVPFLMELAERYPWFTAGELADMIAISESTPGPIGINMATYVGYTTGGVPGALIATLGIVTPAIVIILIIATCLHKFRDSRLVNDAFYGLRPASTALIAAAGLSVVLLSLVDTAAYKASGALGDLFCWKAIVLAAVIWVLTNVVKPTKKLHPIVFIAASAVAGIVFSFAGV